MRRRIDVERVVFLSSLGFLVFLGGALVMVTETFPASLIRDAYRGGTAYYEKLTRYHDRYATDLWAKARTERRGVTVHVPEAAYEGFTLFTSGEGPRALLIDMAGQVVHQWERPFSTVWDDSSPVRRPVADDQVYFRKAHLFPDGSLLALYEGVGDTPYGYGLVRLDRDSALEWKNLDNIHHDLDVTPDGRIVTLSHAFRHAELPDADQFDPPVLEDFLVIIGPDGETLKKLSLLEAVNDSPYRSLLWRIPYYSMEDPLHANAVEYIDARRARWLSRRLPMAAEGQVLVSFRELAGGSLALVDVSAGRVVWASHGPWLAQHDPDVLPGGVVAVFDNRGNFAGPARSRVLEVDLATGGIVWTYAGDADHPLDSPIRASQQRLPNGNTLITESSGGRLVEVTREGRIVWEYVNPVRGGADGNLVPVLSWGQRLTRTSLDPAFLADLSHEPGRQPEEVVSR